MPAFGPSAAAAELEGSKAFAKELMQEAGVPTAGHALLRSREQAIEELARAAYPTVLKADGLAAGKGVIICQTEAEARAAVDVFFTEQRFGADHRRAGGVPRGRGALAAGALRRRQRGAAGAGPGLQADLRRRRGAEHRRHGQLLAGAGLRRRRDRGDRRQRPPPDRRRDGAARHPLPRRPLRRPDDRPRRAQGARVQHPLRRPRDAGGAAAAALRPGRPLPRRPRARRPGRRQRPSSARTGR